MFFDGVSVVEATPQPQLGLQVWISRSDRGEHLGPRKIPHPIKRAPEPLLEQAGGEWLLTWNASAGKVETGEFPGLTGS